MGKSSQEFKEPFAVEHHEPSASVRAQEQSSNVLHAVVELPETIGAAFHLEGLPCDDEPWSRSAENPLNDPRLAQELLQLWWAMQGQREGTEPELIQQVRDVRRQEPGKPERLLSQRMSMFLSGIPLVLWWSEKEQRFLPALYCPGGISDAALVSALLTIVAGKGGLGLRVCPRCTKLFVQSDPRQDWCSDECGNAIRVARWREKEKKSRAKKSRRKRGG
jgi:hypothetical protein